MAVIPKPDDALPAFGDRGAQVVLDRGLVEQLRRWHQIKRGIALPPAGEQQD